MLFFQSKQKRKKKQKTFFKNSAAFPPQWQQNMSLHYFQLRNLPQYIHVFSEKKKVLGF